jgi:LPS export ABC transporter protein LptC
MKKHLLSCLILLIFAGCSLDYSAVYVTEDMSEDIPDSILTAFSHTSVKNGLPIFRLYAGKATIYNKKKETQLSDIVFQEYDGTGEITTEGTADSAVFYTETEDAEFWGNLYFYSLAEEASFATAYLFWSNTDKKLTGKEDAQVFIQKDTGTEIRGIGFEAQARTRFVTFSGTVTGSYILEDEKEDSGVQIIE